MKTIYTEVEIDLDEWTDSELQEEMVARGYIVSEEDVEFEKELTPEEHDTLIDMVINSKPGTIEYNIYEKLRKR